MSDPLAMREEDLRLMLAAQVHKGTRNVTESMKTYVWRRRVDGVHIIHLGKTWEKLMLAARVIVAVENPKDVVVVSSRKFGQRAVFKFAQHTGTTGIGGRYTPGTFTNKNTRNFQEPRVLVATDPRTDHQPVKEASYVNVATIAFVDTDCPLENVDIAIPCNNKSKHSLALMYWLLAREVLRLRATISRDQPWSEMVDLYMYRDAEEVAEIKEKEEAAAAAAQPEVEEAANTTGGVALEGIETPMVAPGMVNPALAAAAPAPIPAQTQGQWQSGPSMY